MKSVSEGLAEARDLVAEGWATGSLGYQGRYCALGAINKAFTGTRGWLTWHRSDGAEAVAARQVLHYVIHDEWPDGVPDRSIWLWNDRHDRGAHRRVVKGFDAAIAEAKRLEIEAEVAAAFVPHPMQVVLSDPVIEEPVIEVIEERELACV